MKQETVKKAIVLSQDIEQTEKEIGLLKGFRDSSARVYLASDGTFGANKLFELCEDDLTVLLLSRQSQFYNLKEQLERL